MSISNYRVIMILILPSRKDNGSISIVLLLLDILVLLVHVNLAADFVDNGGPDK